MATTDLESEPEIIDCDVLLAAKENIQPIASGRRATALAGILSAPHAQREARLASTKNRLRINVQLALESAEEDEGLDSLQAYCNFVYWTVENYPHGHTAESGLLELLEEATRVLKDEGGGRWRGDLRYLKLWLLYASYVERPEIIFKFLVVNEIGTAWALLYEEYAAVLERSGRRGEADKIYLLGIARLASPLEHLKNRHAEFQKRMMVASAVPSPAPESQPTSSSTQAQPKRRTVLGTTSTSTPPPASSSQDFSSNAAHTRANSGNNARLQIFADPTGEEAETADGNRWTELGGRKARVKENVPEVKKMKGTVLKQPGRSARLASSGSGPGTSKIEVYRDPGPEEVIVGMGEPAEGNAGSAGHAETEISPEGEEDAGMEECPPPSALPKRAGKGKPLKPSSSRSSTRASSRLAALKDNDEDKGAPPAAKTKSKASKPLAAGSSKSTAKSKTEVFRDEELPDEPAPGTSQGKTKNSAGNLVTKMKSQVDVHRDEEVTRDRQDHPPVLGTKSTTKSKSKMEIFKDEEPAPTIGLGGKSKMKSKIAVFKDGDADNETAPPAAGSSDGPVGKGKSRIDVFRDSEDNSDIAASKPSDGGGKSTFTPFRDGVDDLEHESPVSGQGFAPFRDEVDTTRVPTGAPALKVKKDTEAEALRKDPFKNYSDAEKLFDDEFGET